MAESANQPQPSHQFPNWPFNCMAFYSHLARDFGGYADTMTRATDPVDSIHAENDFGFSLFHDLMQAYYQLAVTPFTAMTQLLASPLAAEARPAPAKPDTPA